MEIMERVAYLKGLAEGMKLDTKKDEGKLMAAIIDVLGEKGVGVVQGQVEDIAAVKSDFVYLHKTADLFVAAAVTGALSAGADAAAVSRLGDFARHLGFAFQYEDDLLDGDGLYDRERTERLARESTTAALEALKDLPGDVSGLRQLASRLLGRKV